MAQGLRALATREKDWGLIPSALTQLVTVSNSSFRGSSAFFRLP